MLGSLKQSLLLQLVGKLQGALSEQEGEQWDMTAYRVFVLAHLAQRDLAEAEVDKLTSPCAPSPLANW